MAISLGVGILELGANVQRLQGDLGKGVAAIEKFKRSTNQILGTIGVGFTIRGIQQFIKGSIDAADRMNDLGARSGMAAQELLVLQGAMTRNGVEAEAVSDILSKLPKRLEEAARGSGDAAEALKGLGISATQAGGLALLPMAEMLGKLGSKFAEYEASAEKADHATAIFGKGGDRFIPVVQELEKVRKRFEELGITIDQDTLKKADKFNDTLQDIHDLSAATGKKIAAALLPTLQRLAELFIESSKNAREFGDNIQILDNVIKGLVTVAVVAYSVLKNLGDGLGAAAAMVVSVIKGDFSGAVEIFKSRLQSAEAENRNLGDKLGAIWGDAKKGPEAYAKAVETGTKKLPRRTDLDAGKKAAEEAKRLQDALLKQAEQNSKQTLDIEKRLADQRLTVLDHFYGRGLIGERDYYATKNAIQQQALTAVLSALDQEVQAREKALAKARKSGPQSEAVKAETELRDAIFRRAEAVQDAADKGVIAELELAKAMDDYRDSVAEVRAQILELKGDLVAASAIRFEITNRTLTNKARANNDPQAAKDLEDLKRLTAAQVGFNQAKERSDEVTARLAIQEQRIQNNIKLGVESELSGLVKTSAARKAAVAQMEAHTQAAEAAARSAPENTALQLKAEQARADLETLGAEADVLALKFQEIGDSAVADFFDKVISGTASVKDAFRAMTGDIVKQINRLVAQDLSKRLLGAVGSGGSGASFGGFMASLFGGGSAAGAAGADGAGMAFSELASFASGTDNVPRDMLAFIHKGERIVPAAQNAANDSRGGRTVVNHITVNPPPGMDPRTAAQMARQFAETAQVVLARDG